MKALSLFFIGIFFISLTDWGTDFEKAKQTATREHKYILLNFSGSDWCGPCIRLHNEIFESVAFKQLADSRLVLMNADFPRQKKNKLSKELQEQNNRLADLYNPDGIFPLTLLLNEEGKLIKKWDGYPSGSPREFLNQVNAAADAAK
jgi:thioredoxin-related protein